MIEPAHREHDRRMIETNWAAIDGSSLSLDRSKIHCLRQAEGSIMETEPVSNRKQIDFSKILDPFDLQIHIDLAL